MRSSSLLVLVALAGANGCSWDGPSLAGHPGLQYRVISYYNANASERSAVCPNPEMQSVSAAEVIEDSPQRVVMDVRYYWVDWSQASDIGGGNVTTCRDWGERTFTFVPTSDSTLQVIGMSGGRKSG
jgi:hypothetical protein